MMTAIRVIFDGKSFVPQQPVSLPAQSEAVVLFDSSDKKPQDQLDRELRAYYTQSNAAVDADDAAWGKTVAPQSGKAWEED